MATSGPEDVHTLFTPTNSGRMDPGQEQPSFISTIRAGSKLSASSAMNQTLVHSVADAYIKFTEWNQCPSACFRERERQFSSPFPLREWQGDSQQTNDSLRRYFLQNPFLHPHSLWGKENPTQFSSTCFEHVHLGPMPHLVSSILGCQQKHAFSCLPILAPKAPSHLLFSILPFNPKEKSRET